MKKLFAILFLFCILTAVAGEAVLAQTPANPPRNPPIRFFGGVIPSGGVQSGDDFLDIMAAILNWIFVGVMLIAVLMILVAAFQLITAGGDAQSVAQARNKLLWGAVGVGIALLAWAVPNAISGLFGQNLP
ncbi:MAG TPA: hypothetical protein VFE94_03865 [Candidatus Paceibacterota bacterium]|nr:hypothetical protein [Candidatus Paceibacterota bacterium]